MEQNHNQFNYHCPGHHHIVSFDIPPKVHFPERQKIYPMDIAEDSSFREFNTLSRSTVETYFN